MIGKRLLLLFLLLIAGLLFFLNRLAPPTALASGTINVPGDYSTIQAAINAAGDGDLVLVGPGIYNENLVISSKSVILASHFHTTGDSSYIDQTIIDGQGTTTLVVDTDAGPQTRITGFTIQNGNDGILAGATTLIDNNYFTGNKDAIDYEGGSGICRNNTFVNNTDDAIDLDGDSAVIIENNTLQGSVNDGIEIRLHQYSGPTIEIIIRENIIDGSGEDGIQIIDYPDLSDRVLYIERNQITNSAMVGLGLMDNGETNEDYRAASIPERIHLFNNTFSGNPYAVTGGDNLIALNNIFQDSSILGLKNVDGGSGGSIVAHNLFWQNGTDYAGSNIDNSTTLIADPLLDADFELQSGSPAIDAGTDYFVWNNEVVLDMASAEYVGAAPDLGLYESGFVSPTPTPNPNLTTIEIQVAESSDDAEESISGNVTLSSTDLDLVEVGSDAQTVGIRFQNVPIPAGAIISSAYIQFQVDEANSGDIELFINGEAANDAATFDNSSNDVSSRPTTSAQISWSPPDWSTVGDSSFNQRTSNIAPIIQEIANRPGWSSGNSLAVIITGTGIRTAEAYDGVTSGAPVLHIELGDGEPTPIEPNFKVAFIGDSGFGSGAEAVLNLILNEGADMVIHSGDMSYGNEDVADANNWYDMMVGVLGSDYPYFGSMGNHDDLAWIPANGYQDLLEAQAVRAGAICTGDYGINSRCIYGGLEFILSEGGNAGFTTDAENEQYIRDQFANSTYPWKICDWHHNQNAMQIGGKGDATGWGVYEVCLEVGAIIATGHEHSYSRTKTLTSMMNQTVDTEQHPIDSEGIPQNPDNVFARPGKTFAFVSGLGGASIRDQERCLPYDYPYGCNYEWASIATINQANTDHGALFITFYVDGDPNKAKGEFITVNGDVLDSFTIRNSSVDPSPTPTPTPNPDLTTIEIQVAESSDDAEESISGNVTLNSTDLDLVEVGSDAQTVGIRFQNVPIPAGAIISSAYIQFQVDEANSGDIELFINGEAANDAATFDNSSNDVSSRPTTNAQISWSPPDWSTVGDAGFNQRTSNIAPIIVTTKPVR